MAQHQIDPDARPYDPAKLPRKRDVDGPTFFSVDMRAGVIVAVEAFPEARKPAWKIEVDFGPVVGFRSQFLVLGALDADGTVRLLELPDGVEPGCVIA